MESKADELYTCTLEAMKEYKDIVWSLKDTLLERYVLSKDEVFALLSELLKQDLAARRASPARQNRL